LRRAQLRARRLESRVARTRRKVEEAGSVAGQPAIIGFHLNDTGDSDAISEPSAWVPGASFSLTIGVLSYLTPAQRACHRAALARIRLARRKTH